jgi:hypothetical protein
MARSLIRGNSATLKDFRASNKHSTKMAEMGYKLPPHSVNWCRTGTEGVGVEPTNPRRIAIYKIAGLTDAQTLRQN